ncbi:Nn.00g112240.m01.CDS01 [Neocucurbitaria sp. VM-36]
MPNLRAQTTLRIHPTPFKPSFLSIPPSPCSPRTPLTPPPRPISHRKTSIHLTVKPTLASSSSYAATTPPPTPLAWTWTCHQCRSTYHLSVTRRCLEDGHTFCSGTTAVANWRKARGASRVKRHRACASEFDYSGWKVWGRWRRGGGSRRVEDGTTKEKEKDCWNSCDYPSECRWGKRFGVHTPVEVAFPEVHVGGNSGDTLSALNRAVEHVSEPEKSEGERRTEDVGRSGIWNALLASAERRKSGSSLASSPLATVDEEECEQVCGGSMSPSLWDHDGDAIMTTIDPSVLTLHNEPIIASDFDVEVSTASSTSAHSSTSSTSTAASTAVDSLRALINRKKIRRTRSSRSISGDAGTVYAELEGSAPPQRVSSRDSGYHSSVDVV